MTYAEKLRSPKWQKKRLEILHKHDFMCDECLDEESTLHVHHGYYIKHKNPWEYPDESYRVLCSLCHKRWHDDKLDFDKRVVLVSPEFIRWDILCLLVDIMDLPTQNNEIIKIEFLLKSLPVFICERKLYDKSVAFFINKLKSIYAAQKKQS